MRDYVNKLLKNKIPLNNGYKYIATENIAIPVHKVALGISKRRTTNLELVEEMVLRFVSIGIDDLDTIAGTLGLPRDILDITVGDLHVKNLAFHSSGKCILMAKGRESLKTLAISKREKDELQNVYVNAITGEISGVVSKGYTKGWISNYEKMKHLVDGNSLELYRQNMSNINEIFDSAMKAYIDENMKIQDELVSIDSIEDITTGYIVAPIHIYVSESGTDIDIIACNKVQKTLVESIKGIVIEQMRSKKLLKHIYLSSYNKTTNYKEIETFDEVDYQTIQTLNKIRDPYVCEFEARKILLKTRKLFDNELIDFCEYLFREAKSIEIKVNDLNYWSKDSKLLTIGSFITNKTKCDLIYNSSSKNINPLLKKIYGSCPNISKNNIKKENHSEWLSITIDSKIKISVDYEAINIFAKNQYIPYINAYIST